MSKQYKKPSSSFGLPSLDDVSSTVDSIVDRGSEMVSDLGASIWGNDAAKDEASTEVDTTAETPTLDAAAQDQGKASASPWKNTVRAYDAGEYGLAIQWYRCMLEPAQKKLAMKRPDILEAMAGHDPEFAAEIAELAEKATDTALWNALVHTIGNDEWMVEQAWQDFIDRKGAEWVRTAGEGARIDMPLIEFSATTDGVRLDSAIRGAGTVTTRNEHDWGGSQQVTLLATVDVESFYTAHSNGKSRSKTGGATLQLGAEYEGGEVDYVSIREGGTWTDDLMKG